MAGISGRPTAGGPACTGLACAAKFARIMSKTGTDVSRHSRGLIPGRRFAMARTTAFLVSVALGVLCGESRLWAQCGPMAWQKLTASDGAKVDRFGWAAGVSGNVVAVGAPGHDHLGLDAGGAYVFRYTGA